MLLAAGGGVLLFASDALLNLSLAICRHKTKFKFNGGPQNVLPTETCLKSSS